MKNGEGAILADDMGLGKTVMILAYLNILISSDKFLYRQRSQNGALSGLRTKKLERVLIAAPLSLVSSWKRSAKEWLKDSSFPVVVVNEIPGGGVKKLEQYLQTFSNGILICHYEILARESPQRILKKWQRESKCCFDVCIFDEGHKLKSHSTSVRVFAGQELKTLQKVVMTGTPIQNRPEDLHSLLTLVSATLTAKFETLKNFKEQYTAVLRSGNFIDADVDQVQEKNKRARELREVMRPYLLRRTKEQVLGKDGVVQLPKKKEVAVFLPFQSESGQEKAYTKVTELEHVKQGTKKNAGRQEVISYVFAHMSQLRKICQHPILDLEDHERHWTDRSEDCEGGDDEVYASEKVPNQSPEGLINSGVKLQALLKLLTRWRNQRRKFIVFSSSKAFLDLVERAIITPNHFKCLRVDGDVKGKDREVALDTFQDPSDRSDGLLMTVQVGGVGLTLTQATRMVLCDPWWNPAVDEQAVDRMHRIGQRHQVICYRLITRGTIEEHIFKLQTLKRGIAKTTIDAPKQKRYVSNDDLRRLLQYTDPWGVQYKAFGFGQCLKKNMNPERIAWGEGVYSRDYTELFSSSDTTAEAGRGQNQDDVGEGGAAAGETENDSKDFFGGGATATASGAASSASSSSTTAGKNANFAAGSGTTPAAPPQGAGASGSAGAPAPESSAGCGAGQDDRDGFAGNKSASCTGREEQDSTGRGTSFHHSRYETPQQDEPEAEQSNDADADDAGEGSSEERTDRESETVTFTAWADLGYAVHQETKDLAEQFTTIFQPAESDNEEESEYKYKEDRDKFVKNLIRKYHPDKNPNRDEWAKSVTQWLNENREKFLSNAPPRPVGE
ncbi:unnamed protein product [Amoebophrya sp. A120]|nr:unnamed protein product [Amoebophrya sp. A120]|eukprot:GSA120T00017658001.1